MPAPFVVAKGKGRIAERIKEIARAHSVPLVQDPEMVDALIDVELYRFIPESLYSAIAEVLVFVKALGKSTR